MKKFQILFLTLTFVFIQASTTFPPSFIKQPPTGDIIYRLSYFRDFTKNLTLECVADAEPNPSYYWTKDGEIFNVTSKGDRVVQKPGVGTLNFLWTKGEDEGQYQCIAENEFGTARSNYATVRKAFLDDHDFKDLKSIETVEVNENSSVKLRCNVPKAYPGLEVTWTKIKGEYIKVLLDRRMTVDAESSLWFSSVTLKDASTNDSFYACFMTSDYLNRFIWGNRYRLIVQRTNTVRERHSLVLQYVSPLQVAVRGQTIELFCIYGGSPLPKTIWKKGNETIEFSNRIRLANDNRSLVIDKVTESDAGKYVCEVSNNYGERHSKTIEMEVKVAPYFVRTPESVTATAGDEVIFICKANGNPQPDIEWTFNGKSIDEAPRNPFRTITMNQIIIRNVSEDDIGSYGCNASNYLGYVYKDFFLDVVDSPDIEDFEEEESEPNLKNNVNLPMVSSENRAKMVEEILQTFLN